MKRRQTKTIVVIVALALIAFATLWYLHAHSARATTYAEPSLSFSFTIPAGDHVHRELSDLGETLFVLAPDGSNVFQVFISSFDDETPLTAYGVNQVTGLAVANAVPITIGGVAHGLVFNSIADPAPTHLVWFTYEGFLYQAQAFSNDPSALQRLLASWQFQS
jgi:hypothetical protein